MLLPSAVHVSSNLEFGVVFHECHCLALVTCPPPFFKSPVNVIA